MKNEINQLKQKLENEANQNVQNLCREITTLMNETYPYGETYDNETENELNYLRWLITYLVGDQTEEGLQRIALKGREELNKI